MLIISNWYVNGNLQIIMYDYAIGKRLIAL